MSIDLRLATFFLIIVSAIECVEVRVGIKPGGDEYKFQSIGPLFFAYEVSYEATAATEVLSKITQEYGNFCLQKGQKIVVFIRSNLMSEVSASLNVAVGFEKYFDVTDVSAGYDSKINVNDDSELCITWGSWLPSVVKKSEQEATKPKTYFRILSEDIIKKSKFLLLFDNKIQGNYLRIDFKLDRLDSKSNTIKEPFSDQITLKEMMCSEIDSSKGDANILDQSFHYNGDGYFRMYIVANSSEEKDITTFIQKYPKGIDKANPNFKAQEGNVLQWDNLKCLKTGFEFRREVLTPKGGGSHHVI